MKNKIFEQLQARFPKLDKSALSVLASTLSLNIAKEEDIKPALEKLTDEQVTSFVNDYTATQKTAIDSAITKAKTDAENELKAKFDFVEKGKGNDPNPNPAPNPTDNGNLDDKIKLAVAEALKPITDRFNANEKQAIKATRKTLLENALNECKSETFKQSVLADFENMDFADDTKFEAYLNTKKEAVSQVNQDYANANMEATRPFSDTRGDDGVAASVKEYINGSQKDENDPLNGRKINL